MKNLNIRKESFYLYFSRDENEIGKETVRFDLKSKTLEKQSGKYWDVVKHQYGFFYGFTLDSIQSIDPKFNRILQISKRINPTCKTISSIVTRMDKALISEQYIQEGLDFQMEVNKGYGNNYSYTGITRNLSDYDRNFVKLMKKYNIVFTHSIESLYFENPSKATILFNSLDILNDEDRREMLLQFQRGFDAMRFIRELINNFNCEPSALLGYLFNYLKPFENLGYYEGSRLLRDYFNMANQIGRDVKKYPKYLKSVHDILSANYQAHRTEYDQKKFQGLGMNYLEYEGEKFITKIPVTTKEVTGEGAALGHCVASYVPKILKGETYIFFLREKENPEKSLVTLEFRDSMIVQAKGSYNRSLSDEEKEFLKKFSKEKKIEISVFQYAHD